MRNSALSRRTRVRLAALAGGALLAGVATTALLAQQDDFVLRGELRDDFLTRSVLLPPPTQPPLDSRSGQEGFTETDADTGRPDAVPGQAELPPSTENVSQDPWAGDPLLPAAPDQGRSQPIGQELESARLRTLDLDEEPTGAVPAATIDAEDLERNRRIGFDAERAGPLDDINRSAETEPFAATGIRLGSLRLFPTVEQGIGWTSNANSSANGEGSTFSETTLRFNATTDWSRHSARLGGFGILRRDIAGEEIKDTEAGLDGELRLDLAGDYAANARFNFLHRPESASSPVVIEGTATRPDRQTLGGEIGIAKDEGKLRLALAGAVLRDSFEDARLSTGEILSQQDRNSTLATVALRGGYEISPALIPFAEIETGRRIYDEEVDSGGFERSADRFALRGGIEFDLSEKLRGELAVGWLTERPDDAALSDISGLEIGGNVAWSPVRGTTVDLDVLTTVEGSTTPNQSGSLLYAANLGLTREVRANLTADAGLGLEFRDYSGSSASDRTWLGSVGLTYWLSRYLALTGRASHEMVQSSDAGRESDTTSVFFGMRAQR